MRKLLSKRRPSPALVIACIALFAAMGGTSFALPGKNKIDKNDLRVSVVGTKNIKNNAVTGKKIKKRAVSSSRLGSNSVGPAKIKDGAVGRPEITNGAIDATEFGATVVRTGDSAPTEDDDGVQNGGPGGVDATIATPTATATCAAGERLISGGARWVGTDVEATNQNIYIKESYPTANGWQAQGIVDFGAQGDVTLRAFAICLQ